MLPPDQLTTDTERAARVGLLVLMDALETVMMRRTIVR